LLPAASQRQDEHKGEQQREKLLNPGAAVAERHDFFLLESYM
jgi:hypothetical protein